MRGSSALTPALLLSLSCSVMALLLINIARVIVFVDQLEIILELHLPMARVIKFVDFQSCFQFNSPLRKPLCGCNGSACDGRRTCLAQSNRRVDRSRCEASSGTLCQC